MKNKWTVVAVLLIAVGCKSSKKAGDKCSADEASCIDKTNILECQAGVFAQMQCKGPKGCSEKVTGATHSGRTVTTNYAVECDFTAGAEGDPCLDDTSMCSADKTTMVTCKDKKLTRSACLGAKGCTESATKIDCDTTLQPVGAACDADEAACSPDKKQMLHCVKNKFAVAANCRGPKACTVEGQKIGCDHGAQNVADPCGSEGDYECAADKKAILKCGGGKWAVDTKCGKQNCATTGQQVGCR
jgi:hypothetical protein